MTVKRLIRQVTPPIIYALLKRMLNGGDVNDDSKILSDKDLAVLYLSEIQRRSGLHCTDIVDLAAPIEEYLFRPLYSTANEPMHYGSFWVMSKYVNPEVFQIIPPKNFFLQHGIAYELNDWMIKKKEGINFVWSSYIRDLYKEITNNEKIYAVGAPFFYAKSLLTEDQLKKEKERLGKNLLAFPLHSTHYYNIDYDNGNFIKILKEQRAQFDTIRVCLYWKDIQRGFAEPYIKAGFECVCCGYIDDILFLQRQKSFFELADATISNGFGSYIGYSIFLNKPHWLVPEKFKISDTNGTEAESLTRMITEIDVAKRIQKAFFNNNNYIITDEQRDIVDLLWGVSDMKSPNELYELLEEFYHQ